MSVNYTPINIDLDLESIKQYAINPNTCWRYLEESLLWIAVLPSKYYNESVQIQHLVTKYKGKCVPSLFKIPGSTFYAWHQDRTRTCAINAELNQTGSITYFGTQAGQHYRSIQVVDYSKPVLFNTTSWHCVTNPGNERLLLTIGFYGPTYKDVLQNFTNEPVKKVAE